MHTTYPRVPCLASHSKSIAPDGPILDDTANTPFNNSNDINRAAPMANISITFNSLLEKHNSQSLSGSYSLARINDFLKEAYQIVRSPNSPHLPP